MELVGIKPFIEDNSTCWESVIRIVLIVLVSVLVGSDAFPTQSIIFAFEIVTAIFRSLSCNSCE